MVETDQLRRTALMTWYAVAMTALMHRLRFNGHIVGKAPFRRNSKIFDACLRSWPGHQQERLKSQLIYSST